MSTAREIVTTLGGRWYGTYGSCRCPAHQDRNPSLKIKHTSEGGVHVHCFAGCDWRDVNDALRQRGLLPEWVSGGDHGHTGKPRARPDLGKARNAADRADEAKRIHQALEIWRRCVPAPGTLVSTYLRARGITIPIPPSLRYLAAAKHKPTGLILPVMVAGVQGPDGRVKAVHRTFLCRDGTAKASVNEPRMSLGPVVGGAVRLALAGSKVAICEGIETGLSILQATSTPTWAALSAPNMAAVILPPDIRDVILGPDGDEAGATHARQAARRLVDEGRTVRIAPASKGQDFNDMLQAEARTA